MNEKKIYPWYFMTGAVMLFLLLFLIPSMMGIFYSFTDWNRFDDSVNYVGLKNFQKVFSGNSNYLLFIRNTITFTIVSTLVKTVLALALAILFTEKIKLANLHRAIAFAPQVMSMLVVGLVFKAMLHPSTGFLNILLKSIGLEFLARDWLGSIDTAFGTIICVDVWKGVGYGMVIFIAGLQAIPKEYYEAAEIDGAGFWAKVKNVMFPFLLPTIAVNIVLSISYGLRVFDIVYVLTNGGPGYATDVMNTVVFSEFSSGNYAMGSTVATLLALLTLVVSIVILRTVNRKEVY